MEYWTFCWFDPGTTPIALQNNLHLGPLDECRRIDPFNAHLHNQIYTIYIYNIIYQLLYLSVLHGKGYGTSCLYVIVSGVEELFTLILVITKEVRRIQLRFLIRLKLLPWQPSPSPKKKLGWSKEPKPFIMLKFLHILFS